MVPNPALAQAISVPPTSGDTLFKPEAGCARSFIYRNRTYPVDSSRKLDGEGLRSVVKKNPDSERLLNSYQSQLKASFIPAYITTLGAALMITGPIYANTIKSFEGARDTRAAFLFSGLFLAFAGYGYGEYAINHKEKTLEKVVETYNDTAPPPERIRIGLTPTATGTGGVIKTLVPF